MNKWLFIIIGGLILLSCSESSLYQGFSVTESGLNYQIETLGEPYEKVHDSGFVTISITQFTYEGEVCNKNRIISDTAYLSIKDTGLYEFIGLLNIGDSGVFVQKINGKDFLTSVKLLKSVSFQEMKVYNLLSHLPETTVTSERNAITNWLLDFRNDSIEVIQGIYKIKQVSGFGKKPQSGNEVVFHMEGFLSNSEMVESTKKVNKPFSFFMGDKDQVISGVAIALTTMQKAEKSVFIIPSYLAYGKAGSTTQIVSAQQPILYQIDLMDILLYQE